MAYDYDPIKTEAKWQEKWQEAKVYDVDLDDAKEKFTSVVMFPYPSGAKLHVGHWYQYGPTDSYARFMRMRGKNVFFPMGFDAFGLPAENYAIKTGTPPAQSTKENVDTMIEQLMRMGTMYDWSKTLNTSEPEYYRWTQWLFLQMFRHGLAYKKEAKVNYCPKDQTVLANEQVHDGKCERCGTEVIQKNLSQWFWQITSYAQKLLDGLDDLDWPEKTKIMQRNWIGRSEGAEIRFEVEGHKEAVTVFTTRADTLFGATYLVLAPEHPLVGHITPKAHHGDVDRYLKEVAKKTDLQRTDLNKDKTGVFTGAYAVNPANQEHVPIWIADYVLPTYGTGAIMAVPGHDERDWEFAKKFDLPIRQVVKAAKGKYTIIEKSLPSEKIADLTNYGSVEVLKISPNWGKFFSVEVEGKKEHDLLNFLKSNLLKTSEDGGAWYADSMGTTNVVVFPDVYFQVDDEKGMEEYKAHGRKVGVPEEQLDVGLSVFTMPGIAINSEFLDGLTTIEAKKKMIAWLEGESDDEDNPIGRGVVTFRIRDWLVSRQRYWGAPIPIVYDPQGKPHPVPEEHLPWVLPTDVEFRPDGKSPLTYSKELLARTEKIFGKGWTPEFDTMDTFVCSSFYFLRYLMEGDAKHFVDPHREKQWMPVDMYIGGAEHACMHLIYARFVMMALKQFGVVSHAEPFKRLVHQGLITKDGAKMSKSKGNVVSPDDYVARHGADVFRMYLMFMGPYTDGGDWSDTGIKGVDRFVQRAYKLLTNANAKHEDSRAALTALHRAIKSVTESLERLHFNTAISALMELLNALEKEEAVSAETAKAFALLLGPLAPHFAEEIWSALKQKGFVATQKWPHFDAKLIVSDTLTIAVQVNGKLRGTLEVPSDASKEDIIAQAKALENVSKYLEGGVKKEIYVANKLVSFVT